MSAAGAPATIQAVLLDIEGTTTPIAFVYEVLFPYARRRLRRHFNEQAGVPAYASLFDRLRDEHEVDRRSDEMPPHWVEAPPAARAESAAAYCEWLMARDRKSTALKEIQGQIWEAGYRAGDLVGEVFADVPRALERWHEMRLPVAIFSSGSVRAQQLLFRHSSAGDLSRFLHAYFDTSTGSKADIDSYRGIAAALDLPADRILFVSDTIRELDAAAAAGMHTRLSLRTGNALVADRHHHSAIRSFDELAHPP